LRTTVARREVPRWIVLAWNVLAYFPFVYIALAVMCALVGHVVIFRRLLATQPLAVPPSGSVHGGKNGNPLSQLLRRSAKH
jgi:hypothetical protein